MVLGSERPRAHCCEPMGQGETGAAFSLTRHADGAQVPGAVSWSGPTLVLDPSADLTPGADYLAKVSRAARDVSGHPRYSGAAVTDALRFNGDAYGDGTASPFGTASGDNLQGAFQVVGG